MHWVLTVPADFSMRSLLKRSKSLLLPPFSVVRLQRLERVECLSSGKTLLISLTQVPAGLYLRSDQRLNGAEAEEVSQKVWYMLRLGESFSGFSQVLAEHPVLTRCLTSGYRFLRGSTFFEDLVKAQILVFQNAEALGELSFGGDVREAAGGRLIQRQQRLTALVDHLGSPLATNPTRHAFPTPEQVFKGKSKVEDVLESELGAVVITTAQRFLEAPNALRELLRRDVPLKTVRQALLAFPGMNASIMGLAMLALGRYDYLPLEEHGQLHRHAVTDVSNGDLSKIQAVFLRWQPWAGLTYWLWNWQTCLFSALLEEVVVHEEAAC